MCFLNDEMVLTIYTCDHRDHWVIATRRTSRQSTIYKRTIFNTKEKYYSVFHFTVMTGAKDYIFSKCNRMELQRLSHKLQNTGMEYFFIVL